MKIGLHYLLSCSPEQSVVARYRETLEQAVRAEALGFESVWPVEHHFDPQVSALSCPTMLLAAIAARTKRIRLGTAIVQLPLAHPLRVTEELATLDVLSNGRAELGIGRGSNPAHFAGFGVAMAERDARLGSGLDVIRAVWGNEPGQPTLSPPPVQRQVPIRLAANSADTMELAGRLGLPILVAAHVNPFPKLTELLAIYHRARQAAGHLPALHDDLTILMPLFVGETRAEVDAAVAPSVARYVHLVEHQLAPALARCTSEPERLQLEAIVRGMRSTTVEKVNREMGIFDTPRACLARLRELGERLRVGRVIAWFDMGGQIAHERVLRSMDLFAREVLPEL